MQNPFKPTAGAEPPHLIGRDDVILEFENGLAEGVGAPARLMRISGPRGSGKTVLLNDLGDRAHELGWNVVDVSAGADFMDDLLHELQPEQTLTATRVSASVLALSGGAQVSRREPSLRDLMREAAAGSQGLVITIDEVQDAARDDMQRVSHAVQHLIRERQNAALVFAGLPMGVADLVNGEAMTFLRRALSEELGAINEREVGLSLRDSFVATGLSIGSEVLRRVTEATGGYPYLIQLVGYYVWQRANNHREQSPEVTEQDALEGVGIADERFHQAVHEPAIAGISKGALEYLLAMARDEGASSTSAVAKRMGRSTKATSSFRRSLLQRQVIQAPARGYVEFAIPFLREYLIQNESDLLARY